MAEKSVLCKIATLKVKNGTYTKDGVEKNRYQEVEALLSSPHASQLIIKLRTTAMSELKILSVLKDDGVELSLNRVEKQEEESGEIDHGNIPF